MSVTSSTPTGPRPASLASIYAALAEWARHDGLVWIYLFKAIAAALLALGIAMKLDLPQPRTAMTTVFIVMQPQSGMVFAKSFYRICGTLVGLVVMLALIGLFAQQRELFLGATALWVGICTAGASRYRNFRSYGFVLAGYTAALIGIPAAQHPDGAFMSALTRVSEISLAVVCSGIVSAVVFPQYTGKQLYSTARRHFASFVEYVSAALAGRLEPARIEATHARFVADVVGFEAQRSSAIFESPDARMKAGRFARLNGEFMTASTRFHALHQLMNRLRSEHASASVGALEPYFREIAPLFAKDGEPALTADDAAHVCAQLQRWRAALPKRIRATRAALVEDGVTDLIDFDTASELLYRFIHEMDEFTATYASLALDTHARERSVARYVPKTNWLAAGVAGVRAALVMGLLGAFWIASAWPSGSTAVEVAAATCALASAAPFPSRMASQMAGGTLLASIVGLVLTFYVYPLIDGFAMLGLVLTPVLALGVFLTTRPRYAGYGMGYCIFLSFLAGPDNVIQYNPTAFINDALALVLSMTVSAIAFAVFLPPSTKWMRNLFLGELRRQVVHACHARLRGLRNHFESGARDLMFQIHASAGADDALKRDTLRWLFAVLEVGNAAIDLRHELAALPAHPRNAPRTVWREAARAMLGAVSALFARPGARRHARALAATDAAIAASQQTLASFEPTREERHQMQRILSHLHFIRTALIDPQSPLAAGPALPPPDSRRPGAPQQGAHHAA
jgi:uncharacterized membrane protein YccC